MAAEFSLVSVQKEKILSHKSYRSQVTATLLRRLTFHLTAAQLGITGMALLLGFVAESTIGELVDPLIESIFGEASAKGISIFIALAIATILHMIIGEQIPKIFGLSKPLGTSLALAPAFRVYSLIVYPIVKASNGLANWVLKLVGIEPVEELSNVRTRADLEDVFRSSGEGGEIDEADVDILKRSLQFGEKIAMDALVPRLQVESVKVGDTISELVAKALETGYSRFPVTTGDLDDVCGVIHIKSVHRIPRKNWEEIKVEEIMVDVLAIPETIPLADLLRDMGRKRSPMALAIDEHGGTSGIVTAEDILEQIVGEIADEHDELKTETIETMTDGDFMFPGSILIEELKDSCGFSPPVGEYETLGGFVLSRLQRIPRIKEIFHYRGWWFEVVGMESHRITSVKVTQPRDFLERQEEQQGRHGQRQEKQDKKDKSV